MTLSNPTISESDAPKDLWQRRTDEENGGDSILPSPAVYWNGTNNRPRMLVPLDCQNTSVVPRRVARDRDWRMRARVLRLVQWNCSERRVNRIDPRVFVDVPRNARP